MPVECGAKRNVYGYKLPYDARCGSVVQLDDVDCFHVTGLDDEKLKSCEKAAETIAMYKQKSCFHHVKGGGTKKS